MTKLTWQQIADLPSGEATDELIESAYFGRQTHAYTPRYSTDDTTAMLVFKRLESEWPDLYLARDMRIDLGFWRVGWGYDGHGWEEMSAPSIALAVCRAALGSIYKDKE